MFHALGNLIAFDLLGLDPASRAGAALQFFVMDVAKIFTLLILIIYVMGLFRALLSPERVRAYIRGKPQWAARTTAVGLGAVTPFCSCSSVPLFIGFVEAGIPLGVTFSFLIASPMINEVAVVILLGIPLYANATGVIPVAEAMLDKGVAIGTTLAFMMSFAALSLPEMVILRKVIRWPGLALDAGVLAAAFVLVGWGYGIMSTPGVVIDGQVVHAGGVPDRKAIDAWFP